MIFSYLILETPPRGLCQVLRNCFQVQITHLICIDPEGSACMSEDELGIQLEEWEGSDDKQDPSSVSAVEDALLFESKCVADYCVADYCVAPFERFVRAYQ